MINLPCNAASMSQVAPCQNVPVQTSQYNFPTCQQRQTSTQQMQTIACGPCFGTSQRPFAQGYQPDTYITQCAPQPITCHSIFQSPNNSLSNHPNCGQLPQNMLDQIRACVSNTAPIFILPGNCQQSSAFQQQQQPQAMATVTGLPSSTTTASGLTYPTACYLPPPPSFYPYPVPMPFYDLSICTRDIAQNCECCRRRNVDSTKRSVAETVGCRYNLDLDEHYCTPIDDTICTKKSCPSLLYLQALASQFLSMQGIIACAATRLILRKVPGSNVTTTMEDTMAKAQKAINVLTKDQLLSESRNAQKVNALINLHMTANLPPNIIPILTLVQLKMNLLKTQIEGLINQKMMEIQGIDVEMEIDLIDPTVLALKSDTELRDFLSILRQKECDERVNVNFAPYRSQRAIAETRLSNIQNKIRQVEVEFDRRRCAMLPVSTLTSRIVQQFSKPCYSTRFEDPRRLYNTLLPNIPCSPDPFICVKSRSPKRLLLKPCASKLEIKSTQIITPTPTISACDNPLKTNVNTSSMKKHPITNTLQQFSTSEDCICCGRTMSNEIYESVNEAKKKLRQRIAELNTNNVIKKSSFLMKLTSNVCVRKSAQKCNRKSETIMLNKKIAEKDICKSQDAIENQSLSQIMDRQEFTSSANLRQFEKQKEIAFAILRKNKAIEITSLQNISSSKVKQMKTITIVKVTNNKLISNVQKAKRKSLTDYTLLLEIKLKTEKNQHENEQKDKNNKILSIEMIEQIKCQ